MYIKVEYKITITFVNYSLVYSTIPCAFYSQKMNTKKQSYLNCAYNQILQKSTYTVCFE